MSATPPLPRTYQEARWLDDLDPSGAETASDLESLEQDVYHIIKQVLGTNLADMQKGVGAFNYLNGTSVQLRAMPGIIDAQLAQVTRITTSQSSVMQQANGAWLVSVVVEVGAQVLNLQYVLGPNGLSRAT
jgi:hypothetical protein